MISLVIHEVVFVGEDFLILF